MYRWQFTCSRNHAAKRMVTRNIFIVVAVVVVVVVVVENEI
jgi:hypothetical protein